MDDLTRRGFFGTLAALAVGVVSTVAAKPAPAVPTLTLEPIKLGTFHEKSFAMTCPVDGTRYAFEGGRIGETIRVRLPKRFTVDA